VRWTDWLLGRDSPDLVIVRRIRTLTWWLAWANVPVTVYLLVLYSRPSPDYGQQPAYQVVAYLIQAVVTGDRSRDSKTVARGVG